jgi:hypothetical protein
LVAFDKILVYFRPQLLEDVPQVANDREIAPYGMALLVDVFEPQLPVACGQRRCGVRDLTQRPAIAEKRYAADREANTKLLEHLRVPGMYEIGKVVYVPHPFLPIFYLALRILLPVRRWTRPYPLIRAKPCRGDKTTVA